MLKFDENILDPEFMETADALRKSIEANKAQLDSIGEPLDAIFENMNKYKKARNNGN